MRIGIDIDNTICNTTECVLQYINQKIVKTIKKKDLKPYKDKHIYPFKTKKLVIDNVLQWSAEKPNLYNLTIKIKDEQRYCF